MATPGSAHFRVHIHSIEDTADQAQDDSDIGADLAGSGQAFAALVHQAALDLRRVIVRHAQGDCRENPAKQGTAAGHERHRPGPIRWVVSG